MIVTTTHTVEEKRVSRYLGIVFGEVIVGANFIKDFKAGLTNFFGGRGQNMLMVTVCGTAVKLQAA